MQFLIKESDINISTKAIVFDGNKRILILKDSGGVWWDLPGGHLEEGETIEEGLKREMKEEAGLTLESSKQLFVKSLELGNPPQERPVVFFLAKVSGDIKLSEEHTESVWVDIKDIDKYNLGVFLPVIKEIYKHEFGSHIQKIGHELDVTDLGQPYDSRKNSGYQKEGQFTGEPDSEVANSITTQADYRTGPDIFVKQVIAHKEHSVIKSGYSEAGGKREREKPFIEPTQDSSVSSEVGDIQTVGSAATIDKPDDEFEHGGSVGGSGFAGEGPIKINVRSGDLEDDSYDAKRTFQQEYNSDMQEKQTATDVLSGNISSDERVGPGIKRELNSFTNYPNLPNEQRPLGEGENTFWLNDGVKEAKEVDTVIGNFDEAKEQFTNLSADIMKSKDNDLKVLTDNAIKKADLGKPLVIGGWGNYYVVDREGHRIGLDALRRGLEKFLQNPRYANVNIFHSGIQVGELLPSFTDDEGNTWTSHVNDEGLYAVVMFRSDIEIARRAMSEVMKGNLRGFSLSGNSDPATKRQVCEHGICYYEINDVEMYELTLCQVPMNQKSWVTDIIQVPDRNTCPECYEDVKAGRYDSSLRPI